MKIRTDFVTNSSSSSFMCDVCNRTESGYDACLSDFKMAECENNHTFCKDHMLNDNIVEKVRSYINRKLKAFNDPEYKRGWFEPDRDELENLRNDINQSEYPETVIDEALNSEMFEYRPEALCPICSFSTFRNEDLLKYILKTVPGLEEAAVGSIKGNYKTYKLFKEYINKKPEKESKDEA